MVISKVSHTGIDWQKGYYNCHFGQGMVGYLGCHVWTWLCSFNGESQNCIAPWSRFLVGRITNSPQNDPWEANNCRTWLAFINVLGDGGFLISRKRDIITNDHRKWLTAADKGIKIVMGCRGCQKKSPPSVTTDGRLSIDRFRLFHRRLL